MAKKDVHVVWLSGNKAERKTVLEKIKASFGECEVASFGDGCTYDQVESAVLTSDCFDTKRLVILTALPQFQGPRPTFVNNFKKLLSGVPEDCLVVFNGIEQSDERAISGHVAKIGKVFEYATALPLMEAESHAIKLLEAEGKAIESPEANRLVKLLPTEDGKNVPLDQIALAVQKLVCFMERRKNVTAEDISVVYPVEHRTDVWKVFDAIDDRDFDKSVSLLQKLIECEGQGNPVELCIKFLNVSMWRFKLMIFMKEALASGMKPQEAVADAAKLQKLAYDGQMLGMKVSEATPMYTERKAQEMLGGGFFASPLEKYTRKRLYLVTEFIEEALEESRRISHRADFSFVLDLFLMLSCEKIDDNRRKRLWRYFDHE